MNRGWRRTYSILLVTLLCAWTPDHAAAQTRLPAITINGRTLRVDGQPFIVKGIHYGPWRPGSGPNKGYPYPSADAIDADLRLIEQLHANTILVFEPPNYVLDLAARHSLYVLYSFALDWWHLGGPEQPSIRDAVLARVEASRSKPALLGWVLGNEVPSSALDTRGDAPIIDGLADLYRAVKQRDPLHPITHSNWPITKELRLDFLDITSFNVYPLWPPEVVAKGFGTYLVDVLEPLAGEKPLLITEFGANTLEAGSDGQSRLLEDAWRGLRRAHTIGGIVFEFADEWWKNYDNPKRAGDWWDRTPASDDESRHDEDPEEYYGLMTAERQPRAAFRSVQAMFAADLQPTSRTIPGIIAMALVASAAGTWTWAAWRRRHGSDRPGRQR